MRAFLLSRPTLVWLILVAATLFSWESTHTGAAARLATSVVLVVAFIKVRIVGLEFMELRGAPLPMRAAFEAWLVLLGAALLLIYWFGNGGLTG